MSNKSVKNVLILSTNDVFVIVVLVISVEVVVVSTTSPDEMLLFYSYMVLKDNLLNLR